MHVWAAVVLGGAITAFPVLLALFRPGEALTRYTIGVAQMLMGALLIHLTGGRIETHFHVFGSLAFLAFYRDWRVLVPATIVVAADHLLRGMFWPQSVYGVLVASQWRWLEHAAWVRVRGRHPRDVVRPRDGRAVEIARHTARSRTSEQGADPSRDRAGRAGRATARQSAGGRGRDARQERVPRQHEPRAAHAAERHHALQRDAAGGRGRGRT